MKIILGSGSENRKKVLEQMGYDFEVITADIDEKAVRSSNPEELVLSLAKAKTEAIMKKLIEPAILITADQVVICDGQIREKPQNAEEAREFLKSYSEFPAETVSSVVVTNTKTKRQLGGVDRTKVFFKPIPNFVIDQVIADGRVFRWGGGFAVKDPDIAKYVDRIEGTIDSTSGLPKKLTEKLIDGVK